MGFNNGGCGSSANCVNTPGSFNCSCYFGFSGTPPNCINIGACAFENGGCGDPESATCINAPSGILCSCRSGFTGAPPSCIDIDECAYSSLNNCDLLASCTNTLGSYTCDCNDGYYGKGFSCADSEEILEVVEDIGSNINPVPRLMTFWWKALQDTADDHLMELRRASASSAMDAHVMNKAIRKINSIKKAYLKRRFKQ